MIALPGVGRRVDNAPASMYNRVTDTQEEAEIMRIQDLKALLSEMSLDEKIGQLVQLPAGFADGDLDTGPAQAMNLTEDDLRLAGSYLSIVGAEKIRRIQAAYMEKHPHHIPLLFMADIINGYRTVYPVPLAQGCTFAPEVVEACATVAARESAASGVHVTFSPMSDLVRDARWGRVMESTGEDPYLNGVMAAAMVRGYQGDGELTEKGRIAACLKHFAGYGAPEAGRDYNTVELSERTLRDDYLPAYRQAIDAGCELVMTSFNTLDRIPSSANRWLLRDVLRGEMGFAGTVISDWAAIAELLAHGIAADPEEAAALAIHAGVDIDMSTPIYLKNLKKLVADGKVPEALIDEAAFRVLALKNKLGLFENPYRDASEAEEGKLLLAAEHRQTARECAERSFVLLKNEERMLPLRPEAGQTVAFIGPYADNQLLSGSWSFFGEDGDCVTLKAGIQQLMPPEQALFAPGCPMLDPGVKILGFQKDAPVAQLDPEEALREAVALAKRADRVVLALGEHREQTGEATSRANLSLPDCQMRLLEQVAQANPNVIVVLFCGRPLDIRELSQRAKAVLVAWLPGVEGGNALARVLLGHSAPSGKLAMSFPYSVGQVPVHYNHLNTGRPFHGDYRSERFFSKYIDIPNEPLYPFGFGLTYTAFECSPVRLDADQLARDGSLQACVRLTNTGDREGTETLQLYIHDMAASVARPVRELKAFRQVTLKPGESREVSFRITESMLRFHDVHMRWTSEPGQFEVFIGTDSRTQSKGVFTLVD